jgi:hypothetical protein
MRSYGILSALCRFHNHASNHDPVLNSNPETRPSTISIRSFISSSKKLLNIRLNRASRPKPTQPYAYTRRQTTSEQLVMRLNMCRSPKYGESYGRRQDLKTHGCSKPSCDGSEHMFRAMSQSGGSTLRT